MLRGREGREGREGPGRVENIMGDRDQAKKVRRREGGGEIAAKHLEGFRLFLMDVSEI